MKVDGGTTTGLAWKDLISRKLQNIAPSGIRVFFDIVSQRQDIISLGVGEPDFTTPQVIVNTAIQSLRDGYTYYTGNQGLPQLRKAISRFLSEKYKVDYNPDNEILITVGVSQGIDIALRSILNPGDGVLYGSPSYVSYSPMIELANGKPQQISTSIDTNFLITPEKISETATAESKVLFLNYPSNPTGASFNNDELEKIAAFAKEKNLLILSDEIYCDLTYDREHQAISSLPGMKERTMLLGGFSKNFAMTGWRIGFAAGPSEWLSAMLKIHQYSTICAPTTSQFAAISALELAQKDSDRMRDIYRERRDLLVEEYNRIGLPTAVPNGAFYTFSDIKSTGLTSIDFARTLLDNENVAVIPGNAFGEEGEGYIRSAYASSGKNLKLATEKINRFLQTLR